MMETTRREPLPSRSPPSEASGVCPWCRAVAAREVWARTGSSPFRLVRCSQCGLVRTDPQLDDEQIAAYYTETYYGEQAMRLSRTLEAAVRWFRRRRAATLRRLMSPGRVLDIGCGRGWTLAALRDAGWQVEGVELNDAAARHAREVLQLNVACDGFDPSRYEERQFDAIILWHVLEHLRDVRDTLEACARLLKPGGMLVVAVPNFSSWQARWSRYAWFHLDLPRHYSHFSSEWLQQALDDLGFGIVLVNHASVEQNVFGWIQSALNGCGLRHNLLYDLLRRGGARTTARPWRDFPLQSLVSLAGLAVLLLPAAAMLVLEGLLARGATVEIYAVLGKPTELPAAVAAPQAVGP